MLYMYYAYYIVVWRRAFHRSHAVISGRGGRRMTNERAHTRESIYIIIIIIKYVFTRTHTHPHYTVIIFIIYIWRGLLCNGNTASPLTACKRRTIAARRALPFGRLVLIFFFFLCVYSA